MSLRPPQLNGSDKSRQQPPVRPPVVVPDPNSVLDLWGMDDPLQKELKELAARNRALLHPGRETLEPTELPLETGKESEAANGVAAEEVGQLRRENEALRLRVAELEQLLENASSQAEEMWAEQQREYEALLEEKSEVIRSLHLKIQQLKEEASQARSGGSVEDSATTEALRQEVQQLRQQLERQQRQIEEDEEALHEQMKQMELAMSRERVEMARQRAELQRMYQEYQRELEMAQRDGNLRERLAALQRRQQDGQSGNAPPAPQPNTGSPPVRGRAAAPTMTSLPNPARETDGPRSTSGLLGKLFGKK